MYRHLGHMSWAADTNPNLPGGAALREDHAARLAFVSQRIQSYAWPPCPPCGVSLAGTAVHGLS
jgi:hypothetical protein